MALEKASERLYQDLQDPAFARIYLKLVREEGLVAYFLALWDLNIAVNDEMIQTAITAGFSIDIVPRSGNHEAEERSGSRVRRGNYRPFEIIM